MATIFRSDFEGALHHVFGRGNNKQTLFFEDKDRRFFLGKLKTLKEELHFGLHAYCLMSNHFHFLIETGPTPLSSIMGRLLTAFAVRFHGRNSTVGHVFQGRYGARLCRTSSSFLRILRYIHRNPVAAGMVKQPQDWPWSGHRELLGIGESLLDARSTLYRLAPDVSEARGLYKRFTADSIDDAAAFNEILELDEITRQPDKSLDAMVAEIAEAYGVDAGQLISGSRKRSLTMAKIRLIKEGLTRGYSQASMAQLLKCCESAVSQLIRRDNLSEEGRLQLFSK